MLGRVCEHHRVAVALRIEAPTTDLRFKAWVDLLAVCREAADRMSLDAATGVVLFHGRAPDGTPAVICEAIAEDPAGYEVVIRPDSSSNVTFIRDPWVTPPPPGVGGGTTQLCARGVIAFPAAFIAVPGSSVLSRIDLLYDSVEYPGDQGYRGYDANGDEIPVGPQHLLAFGLGSAGQIANQLRAPPVTSATPWSVDGSVSLIVENAVRANVIPRPRVGPLELYLPTCPSTPGRRTTPPPPKKEVKGAGHGIESWKVCFVATAACGSGLAPEVQLLREFRDKVLRETRAGGAWFDRFYGRYGEISPPIVERMRADPEVAELIRIAIVQPYVGWLELAMKMPDASLEQVPEPWRRFLELLMARMDAWASEVGMPESIDGLGGLAAARELAVLLRYGFRDHGRRLAYLDRLAATGALPLRLRPDEAASAREILLDAGLPAAHVARVVEAAPGGSR